MSRVLLELLKLLTGLWLTVLLMAFAILVKAEPSFSFPETKIELPPLPLLENAKPLMPPPFSDPGAVHVTAHRVVPKSPNLVSRMPLIAPKSGVEYHLQVKAPDESIDYKLLVKTPDVAPAR